jgi:hypothetical protein
MSRMKGSGDDHPVDQLIAEGRAWAPEVRGDLLDVPPAERIPGAPLPSDVLAAMREEER